MLERQTELIAVGILFLVLTWIAVGLRVYARAVLLKKWGHDDSAMTVTLVLFTLSVVIQIVAVAHGHGRQRSELRPEQAHKALFYCYLYEIFYVLVGVALKIALGIFYLRVAIERWQIILIKVIVFASASFGVACLFLVVLQCIPVSSFWLVYPSNDKCIPIPAQIGITYALNGANALTDWILGTLPFFIVRSLNLDFRTKVMVASLLVFAAVGSTGTIVRMKYVKNLTHGPEFLYVTVDVSIWSTVEPGIGITAASIATLRPLFQTVLWRLGFAPPPSFLTARPIRSPEGSTKDHYRLHWFKPKHRAPDLAHIQSAKTTQTSAKPSPHEV